MIVRPPLTTTLYREGKWIVSWCPELDIASQGETREEARANLVEAIELYLEVTSPQEVIEKLNNYPNTYSSHVLIQISVAELACRVVGAQQGAEIVEPGVERLHAGRGHGKQFAPMRPRLIGRKPRLDHRQ